MPSKNQIELRRLLKLKGFEVESVWCNRSWDYSPGWHAEMTDGTEYHLGRDIIEAKGQIQNDEIVVLN